MHGGEQPVGSPPIFLRRAQRLLLLQAHVGPHWQASSQPQPRLVDGLQQVDFSHSHVFSSFFSMVGLRLGGAWFCVFSTADARAARTLQRIVCRAFAAARALRTR